MAFSINQVRHLYVAKALKTGNNLLTTDAAGSILPKGDTAKTHLYFQYMSPGGIVRSDLIAIDKIMHAKATASKDLAHKLARVLLTIDPMVSTTPVAGQEYITRITFSQYIGLGEEDKNTKYGYVNATPSMTASDFYKKMAISIANNVSRDTTPLVTVYLKTSSSEELVEAKAKEESFTGTYTGIILEEAVQAWELGTMPQDFIKFDVQATPITVDGDDYIWGKVEKQTPTKTVEDGHNIADLEYFCMGARGDHYRMMGYPNVIKTTYLVDPTAKYDTLDIHYAFTDSNEGVQKSEKDITLVCVDDGSHTVMNALITAVNALLPTDKQITSLQTSSGNGTHIINPNPDGDDLA